MLAAAVAASLMSVPAMAQIRAGQDGHASDSSNRVGSGGYNSGGYIYNNGINSNQVIYGNVTGGQWFHGPGERDPRQFTGPSGATLGDEFIRGTSGVPTAYQPATPQYAPQAFYGAGRSVAPPTGTQRLGYTGSFVGTGTVPVGPLTLQNNIAASSDVLRQSPGLDNILGQRRGLLDPETGDLTALPPNQAILDASSPLYNLQGLPGQPGSENGQLPMFAPPSLAPGGTDRFRMQQSEIERLRNELQSTPMDQGTQQNGANGNAKGGPNQNAAQQNGALSTSSSLNNAAEQPNGSNLNGQQQQQNTSTLNSGTLNNGNTPQGQQQRSTLVQPRVPGGQANVLRERFDQYLTPQMRVLRANAQNLNVLSRIKNKVNAPGERGATTQPAGALDTSPGIEGAGPQGYVSTTPMPGAGGIAAGNGNVAGQPVKITSLADGVSAKGLHDLLKSAEELMRQDKFESAIEKYNAAEQVAPRDTLIALGRANAELGAGFYHRASTELHNVFGMDPALLMGQYDLKSWFSPRRLQFITKELSDLAASDPKSEDPVFLLAYIWYNTGDTAKAADYLKQARTRSGGRDYLLDQLESRWKLAGPSVPASGLNK
jgi:tetratricopeptide (TPR) repeat protein